MTLKELANEVGRDYAIVKRVLRYHFADDKQRMMAFRSVDARLEPHEIDVVRRHAANEDWGPWIDEAPPEQDELEAGLTSLDGLPTHPLPAAWPKLAASGGFEVHVHNDVLSWCDSDGADQVRRQKLTRHLTTLVERGTVERSKSVQGAARGWFRANMGGNNGKQFYLWYRSVDWRPTQGRRGVVVVREVRHHDETPHDPGIGVAGEYIPLQTAEIATPTEGGYFCDPLVERQRDAAQATDAMQIVRGTPGTGKTTTLHEVLSRLTGNVLYLTFDRQLVERTRDREVAFPSPERVLTAQTFDDWCLQFHDAGPAPLRLAAAHRDLIPILERLPSTVLGPWTSHKRDLFDELYANAFGRAVPWSWGDGEQRSDGVLPPRERYVERRSPVLGTDAAEKAWDIAARLTPEQAGTIFGRPVRAHHAAERIVRGEHDALLRQRDWDAILVDEVQDLTAVELAVILAVAWRLAVIHQRIPLLRFAGDEGQTVRPTAFEWATLKNIFLPLGRCAEAELEVNLRSPERLAVLVNNATEVLYGQLQRDQKPRGVQIALPDDAADGGVLRSVAMPEVFGADRTADSDRQAERRIEPLLRQVAAIPAAAVLVAGSDVPQWLRQMGERTDCPVMTSTEAKGLDFRVVALVDAGDALVRQRDLTGNREHRLDQAFARVSADRLRVAISRATETLLFADRYRNPEAEELYAQLGFRGADSSNVVISELTLTDAIGQLDVDGVDAADQYRGEISRIQQLIDENPEAAAATSQRLRSLLLRLRRDPSLSEHDRADGNRWCARALFRGAVARLRDAGVDPVSVHTAAARDALEQVNTDLRRDADLRPLRDFAHKLALALATSEPDGKTLGTLADLFPRVTELAPESRADLAGALRGGVAWWAAQQVAEREEIAAQHAALRRLMTAVAGADADADPALCDHRRRTILTLAKLARGHRPGSAVHGRIVAHARELAAQHTSASVEVTEAAHIEAELLESEGELVEAARFYESARKPLQAIRCLRNAGALRAAHRIVSAGAGPEHRSVLAWAVAVLDALEAHGEPGDVLGAEECHELRTAFENAIRARNCAPRKR